MVTSTSMPSRLAVTCTRSILRVMTASSPMTVTPNSAALPASHYNTCRHEYDSNRCPEVEVILGKPLSVFVKCGMRLRVGVDREARDVSVLVYKLLLSNQTIIYFLMRLVLLFHHLVFQDDGIVRGWEGRHVKCDDLRCRWIRKVDRTVMICGII